MRRVAPHTPKGVTPRRRPPGGRQPKSREGALRFCVTPVYAAEEHPTRPGQCLVRPFSMSVFRGAIVLASTSHSRRCRTATSSPSSGPSGAGYQTTRCQGVRSEDESQKGELCVEVESLLENYWRYPITPIIIKRPIKIINIETQA